MKELGWYIGATYSDICQTKIMTKTSDALSNPDLPIIATNTGANCTKIESKMTELEKKNIDEAIRQN